MNQQRDHELRLYQNCLDPYWLRTGSHLSRVTDWKAIRSTLLQDLMPRPEPKPIESPKQMLKRLRIWSHKIAHKVGVHFCEACGGAYPDDKTMKSHECNPDTA